MDADKRAATSSPQSVFPEGESFQHQSESRVDPALVEKAHDQVRELVRKSNFVPEDKVDAEVNWFFKELGIDEAYFVSHEPAQLAEHVLAVYGSKISAKAHNLEAPDLQFRSVQDSRAAFFHTSSKGRKGTPVERELDEMFLDRPDEEWTLESYRSVNAVASEYQDKMRCYFLRRVESLPVPSQDLYYLSERLQREQEEMVAEMGSKRVSLVVRSEMAGHDGCRITIAYKKRVSPHFFSSLSDLYHYYDLYSTRKYSTPFPRGVRVINLFLMRAGNKKGVLGGVGALLPQLLRDVSLLFPISESPMHQLFQEGKLSIQECVFSLCAGVFAQHFFNRLGPEYEALKQLLTKDDVAQMSVLENIRQKLRSSTMPERHVWETLKRHPEVLHHLYVFFSQHHLASGAAVRYSAQSSPLLKTRVTVEDIEAVFDGHLHVPEERALFRCVLTFAQHVLKTNFFKSGKTSISFRLDPAFLRREEFPDAVFGLFLVVGSEFRGFHVRFQDIARGGIRVIQSRSRQAYDANLRSLFDENYNLAHTQQRKNKDIPEGGAKGAILMHVGATQQTSFTAFKKYISALLDLLESHVEIVDSYGKPEMLFFGPDEGTADFMDWASSTARRRGFKFWKALTTGKHPTLGGIPHDLYGMTTRSIRQFVVGVQQKLGLDEQSVTKLQTGGPDGDLGSNEIKISHDKTIAIVDGSGVIYDPNGLNRTELNRLALERKMIDHFDLSLLSDKSKAFRVLVSESNVVLPSGEEVSSGTMFRNLFHLHPLAHADLFVPCGGRPESVHVANVSHLIGDDGVAVFKAVVEGANLFFSEQARLALEAAGAVLIKDASANKGGVTSSSLEVLGALALSDDEYSQLMCVAPDGSMPSFREQYVAEVIKRIEENARREFECIWREHDSSNEPFTVLSNRLSIAINRLTAELSSSSLWEDLNVRRHVLSLAVPSLLQEKVGLDTLLAERIPLAYQQAMFSSYLASRFVYEHGINPSAMSFYSFMKDLKQ